MSPLPFGLPPVFAPGSLQPEPASLPAGAQRTPAASDKAGTLWDGTSAVIQAQEYALHWHSTFLRSPVQPDQVLFSHPSLSLLQLPKG